MFKHGWQPATGVVIDTRFKGSSAGDHGSTEHFLIEVTPEAGEAFRVELGYPGFAADFRAPQKGQTVKMKCNPDHDKAAFDTDDPSLSWKSQQQQKQADWKQELEG
jgi:hypothetical protein